MGIAAAIIGVIGGLCAAFGVLTAADIIPADMGLTTVGWEFWLILAGVLFLGSIVLLLGRRPEGD